MKKIKSLISMLFIAVIIAACGGDKNSPETASKQFIEMFASGDTSNVANIVDLTPNPNDPEDVMTRAIVSEKLGMLAAESKKHYDSQGGLKDITFEEIVYNADKTEATVNFVIHYKDGASEESAEMDTIKTKDGWRVKF